MTAMQTVFWLDPVISQAMAKSFELRREWLVREWETLSRFREIMGTDAFVSPAENPVLPGIFVDWPQISGLPGKRSL
jgi:hypothetical protein